MADFGNFGFGSNISTAKLSKMLLQSKQISSDITNIIPVHKDKELVGPALKKTPVYEQLTKTSPLEMTEYWDIESSDNFGKFTDESNAATRFAAQKGTYGSPGSVLCRLMTYVMNIGLIAQKNVRNGDSVTNLVMQEQKIALEAMRKGIERCLITGAPAAATDGGVTDALAFSGLDTLVTTNVDAPASAESISIDKVDAQMDNCIANGAVESDLIAITDQRTLTNFSGQYYNTQNIPLKDMAVNAGIRVASYRQMPIFVSDYSPTTTQQRKFYIVDTGSTTIPEFYGISQLDLGRTQLSDDSIMFWMGALAVKRETRNAIITKII